MCVDLLRAGQTVRFTATGTSMTPAIRHGDVLTVVPVPATELRPDDVVLYLSARGLTAHRVVRRLSAAPAAFEARADAPGSPLERVPEAAVLGRVTRVERTPRTFTARLAAAGERGVRLTARLVRLRRRLASKPAVAGRPSAKAVHEPAAPGAGVDEPSQLRVDRREISS